MSIYYLIPLASVIAYSILTAIALRDTRTRIRKFFAVYLIISLIFAFITMIVFAGIFPNQLLILCAFLPIGGVSAMISHYHFVCAFTNKGYPLLAKLGYGLVLFIFIPLAFMGYFPQSAELASDGLTVNHGPMIYIMGITGFSYMMMSIRMLVKKLRSSNDPVERNRVSYLLSGIGLFLLLGIRESIPPLPKFCLNQVGHFFNALIISYTILRYQLLEIRLVIRKGIVYTGITAIISGFFLSILFVLNEVLHSWSNAESLAAVVVLGIVIVFSLNRLKSILEKGVNLIFYGKTYDYRKMVSNYTKRMSNVLDLDQLAEAMLPPISKALQSAQTSLLMPENDYFTLRHAVRFYEEEPAVPIKLRADSPIVDWFNREKRPLCRDTINVDPSFKALWESDIDAIADIEILFPLISKNQLVGILTLGSRCKGSYYNSDDIELITTMTDEAAVVIENAELYAQAKARANVDELTGLFNHRYFHQRIHEEIARASRFGEVFCLLSMDIDFFKSHNDIYGHLYGDDVLRRIGKIISRSIRSMDIAFRYGGDEFSIILPQTAIDYAFKVAERIRKTIESDIDTKGSPLTCSIGVASWPTDGVMREELVRSADIALYHAKQTAKNRTSVASELPISELTNRNKATENKDAILNTIYALAATVDAKDKYTYGHSKKVSKYASDIAEELGLSEERVRSIRAAALLHDIGKIGVSDDILNKSGPLTIEDWEPIHAHPTMGVSILKHVDSLRDSVAAIQYHHEHYNGSGYPSGLKGSNIPLDARILAVADSFDAMTSSRPYRNKAKTQEEALDELRRCSGTQFDPDIVRVFVKLMTPPHSARSKTRQLVNTST